MKKTKKKNGKFKKYNQDDKESLQKVNQDQYKALSEEENNKKKAKKKLIPKHVWRRQTKSKRIHNKIQKRSKWKYVCRRKYKKERINNRRII